MKITEVDKFKNRIRRKLEANQLALDIMSAFNRIDLKGGEIKRRIERQFNCSSKIEIYSNDETRTWFCGQKTCKLCNSIRMAKLSGIYKDQIENYDHIYHLTLTMKSAFYEYSNKKKIEAIDLKHTIGNRIDDMFKFWHNSAMCKTDLYRKLSKEVNFIRSWEVTFNSQNTLHPHYHILLASNDEGDIKTLGNFIISYWMKWWHRRKIECDRGAQRLEPIRKTVLENFKYCLKLTDIKNSNASKLLEVLRVTNRRRLFTQKGFMSEAKLKSINEKEITDIEDHKKDNIKDAVRVHTIYYDHSIGGFYSKSTGEIFDKDLMMGSANKV